MPRCTRERLKVRKRHFGMAQHFPSSVGADAVRKAYAAVFGAITLKVEFQVAEVLQIAPDSAIARTNSVRNGNGTCNRRGRSGGNQELFVFQKLNDGWKIARYSFSTTNPPPH